MSLEAELAEVVSAAKAAGLSLVAVGAHAVRAYLDAPDRRVTQDVDVVVFGEGLPRLCQILEARGYRVYQTGPWWRAERGQGSKRMIVDVAVDAVVDVLSFTQYPLDPHDAVEHDVGGVAVPFPPLEDVVAMKLIAHRDKDLVDVVCLLRDAGARVDAEAFRRRVAQRDVEIQVRRGALELEGAARSGALSRLWEERFGARLQTDVLEGVLTCLGGLL